MENATDPASTLSSTKVGFSSTSTEGRCLNFAALLDAERKKIANETHEKAIIVSTAVGALLAIGLILNAIVWGSRLRHRRLAKQRIREAGLQETSDVERNASAPPPDVAYKRTSSRLSMLSRRHSQWSHHSDVSEVLSLDAIASRAFDPSEGGSGANMNIEINRIHPARTSSASADLLETSSRASVPAEPTLQNTPPIAMTPSKQSLALRTTPKQTVYSVDEKSSLYVAEAYDDVPENPTELSGYAVYGRCKRETERARMAKQSQYTDKPIKSSRSS